MRFFMVTLLLLSQMTAAAPVGDGGIYTREDKKQFAEQEAARRIEKKKHYLLLANFEESEKIDKFTTQIVLACSKQDASLDSLTTLQMPAKDILEKSTEPQKSKQLFRELLALDLSSTTPKDLHLKYKIPLSTAYSVLNFTRVARVHAMGTCAMSKLNEDNETLLKQSTPAQGVRVSI